MKRFNLKFSLIVLAIIFVMISCGGSSSIDKALSQMEKAMDKVEKNKTSMTEADWKALNEELEKPAQILTEALDSPNIGALKKIKISAVVLRYSAVAAEAAFHTVTDQLKIEIEESQLEESVSEISKQYQEILEIDEMNQIIQELKKVGEELQNIAKE